MLNIYIYNHFSSIGPPLKNQLLRPIIKDYATLTNHTFHLHPVVFHRRLASMVFSASDGCFFCFAISAVFVSFRRWDGRKAPQTKMMIGFGVFIMD